ncbi:MAG: murein biosynthesis integral membrane protein MurJ [Candidatus Brocadiia bacterium]
MPQEQKGSPEKAPIVRSIFSYSLATLLSRISGFVRETAWAALIGPTQFSDIFLFVYTIPNLMRRLLGEGAIASAFVPLFNSVEKQSGIEEARKLSSTIYTLQTMITTAFTVLTMLVCIIIRFTAPPDSTIVIYAEYLAVLAPYAVFICADAFLASLLNARRIYFLPNMVQVIINVFWLGLTFVAVWAFQPRYGLTVLGGGVVAVCAYTVWMLAARAKKEGVAVEFTLRHLKTTPALQGFFARYWLVILGSASYTINVLIDRLFVQFLVPGEGAMTIFYQGERLMQLPLGVLAVSVGTVALTELSKSVFEEDKFRDNFTRLMRIAGFLAIPTTVVMVMLAVPLVDFSLNYGKFAAASADLHALSRAANVLICYMVGLPAFFLMQVLTKVYFSINELKITVRVSTWMIVFNVVANIAVLRYTTMGESGLALTSSIASWLSVLLLSWALHHRMPKLGSWAGVKSFLSFIPAAAIAGVGLWACLHLFDGMTGRSVLDRFLRLAVPSLVFFGIYFAVNAVFRVPEARSLVRRLFRRSASQPPLK